MADVVCGETDVCPRSDALSEYDDEVMLATREWKFAVNTAGETYLLLDRTTGESTNCAGCSEFLDVQRALELRLAERRAESSTQDRQIPTITS